MMYCGRCPANRGAVAKPFTSVPWHQVQFRTAAGSSPPASAGTVTERITSNAILIFLVATICSLNRCAC
jgi:hypothetical protein